MKKNTHIPWLTISYAVSNILQNTGMFSTRLESFCVIHVFCKSNTNSYIHIFTVADTVGCKLYYS